MNILKFRVAPKLTIGIPSALLTSRYATLWRVFFEELGMDVIFSPATNLDVMDKGTALAIDESCLSLKIYLGHVRALIGHCDAIFVPRIDNFGEMRGMCTRFSALYDTVQNVFRDTQQRFVTCNVDVLGRHDEEGAYIRLGGSLGFPARESRRAWQAAVKADQREWRDRVHREDQRARQDGFKVLLVGHSYILDDAYIGKPVLDFLEQSGVIALRADVVDRDAALRRSRELSPTCKWEMSRELVGSLVMRRDRVDGVILLSAFPCGPDSIVNDLIQRRVKDVPVLNLVLDGQNGNAGMETRLESFIDIVRMRPRIRRPEHQEAI